MMDRFEMNESSSDGKHVYRLSVPNVPCGREDGYVINRQSAHGAFGCSCGFFVDGTAKEAIAARDEHCAKYGQAEHNG